MEPADKIGVIQDDDAARSQRGKNVHPSLPRALWEAVAGTYCQRARLFFLPVCSASSCCTLRAARRTSVKPLSPRGGIMYPLSRHSCTSFFTATRRILTLSDWYAAAISASPECNSGSKRTVHPSPRTRENLPKKIFKKKSLFLLTGGCKRLHSVTVKKGMTVRFEPEQRLNLRYLARRNHVQRPCALVRIGVDLLTRATELNGGQIPLLEQIRLHRGFAKRQARRFHR